MRKNFISVLLILLIVLVGSTVYAQERPPQILSFTVDSEPLIYDEVEAGIATAHFSWNATRVIVDHTMQMHALVANQWQLIGEGFPAISNDTLIISHPLSFDLPTYRLSVVDRNNQILNSRVISLPYAETDPDGAPEIAVFTSTFGEQPIPREALLSNDYRIPVNWRVENRLANTNLVFEQQLADGIYRSAELPRTQEWVRSGGDGIVSITNVNGNSTTIRMRVVDIDSGTTLDSAEIIFNIVGTSPIIPTIPPLIPSATPTNANPSPTGNVAFTAPGLATLGEAFTLTWDASTIPNADEVVIREWNGDEIYGAGHRGTLVQHFDLNGGTPAREWNGLPLQGSLEVIVDDYIENDIFPNVTVFSIYLYNNSAPISDYGYGQHAVYLRSSEEANNCTPYISVSPANINNGETIDLAWDPCGKVPARIELFNADNINYSPILSHPDGLVNGAGHIDNMQIDSTDLYFLDQYIGFRLYMSDGSIESTGFVVINQDIPTPQPLSTIPADCTLSLIASPLRIVSGETTTLSWRNCMNQPAQIELLNTNGISYSPEPGGSVSNNGTMTIQFEITDPTIIDHAVDIKLNTNGQTLSTVTVIVVNRQ